MSKTLITSAGRVIIDRCTTSQIARNTVCASSAKSRSLILKPAGAEANPPSKGILAIKFTETFAYYLKNFDIDRLTKDYFIYLEPSWAGYAVPEILGWSNCKEKIFIATADESDYQLLSQMDSVLKPIKIGSGDWVDFRIFHPLDLPKQYDVVYIANFNPVKRIWLYLQTVNKLKKHDIRAALICSRWGGEDTITPLLTKLGLESHIDLYINLSHKEINEVLNKSKVNILLSRKEGSNRSLFEGFFSNTPGILLEENIGVNKENINSKTGKIIHRKDLASEILWFRENYQRFSPRDWAMENISPRASTKKLVSAINECLESHQIDLSKVRVKINNPEMSYLSPYKDKEQLVDTLFEAYKK